MKKRWLVAVGVAVVIGGGVGIGAAQMRLGEMRETLAKIEAEREAVASFLETGEGMAVETVITTGNEVVADKLVCRGARTELCEKLATEMAQLEKVSEEMLVLKGWAENSAEVTDEALVKIASEGSGLLKEAATEMLALRAEVAEFQEKYAGDAEDKTEMLARYGEISVKIRELESKYEIVSFEELFGKSKEELMQVFSTADELRKQM